MRSGSAQSANWVRAVDWEKRNVGYSNSPFAILGCPCEKYSHYCAHAELWVENQRLHRMICDHVKYGHNKAMFDYVAAHPDGDVCE